MRKEYNIKDWKVRINLDKERAELLEYFLNKILDRSYNSYKEIKNIIQEMDDILEYSEIFQFDIENRKFNIINIGGIKSSEIENLYIINLKSGANIENTVKLMEKEKNTRFLALVGENIKIYSGKKLPQSFLSKYAKNAKKIKIAGKYESCFWFKMEEDLFGTTIYTNPIMEIVSAIELYLSAIERYFGTDDFSSSVDEITYSYKMYLNKAEQLIEEIKEFGVQQIIEDVEELIEIAI